jgi:hypothetical protein
MKQPPSQWRTRLVIAVLSICVILQALLSLGDRMHWSSRSVLLCGSAAANITTAGLLHAGQTPLAAGVGSSSNNSNTSDSGSSSSSLVSDGRAKPLRTEAATNGSMGDAAAAAAAAGKKPVVLQNQGSYWDYRWVVQSCKPSPCS